MSRIRAGIIVFVDILLFTTLIMMYYLDKMVNDTLYHFGLIADVGWMQPYYLLSRFFVVVTIAAIIMVSLAELPISAFKED
jgi:hypothetical protein